eukprot:259506-Rhodomonas_salina.3
MVHNSSSSTTLKNHFASIAASSLWVPSETGLLPFYLLPDLQTVLRVPCFFEEYLARLFFVLTRPLRLTNSSTQAASLQSAISLQGRRGQPVAERGVSKEGKGSLWNGWLIQK